MVNVTTIAEARAAVAGARQRGLRIGLVPTMGALHAGHTSLMELAAVHSEYRVVTIFVNPLQFGAGEDLDRYPRSLKEDLAICRRFNMDLVFAPPASEMYPQRMLTHVEVAELSEGLCGASRPGHFRGVATVVAKLLNIVQPDVAVFGQKDAQQAAVIRRMVADLNVATDIVVGPTVREADGLAVSSRNRYLKPEERQAAPVLCRALMRGREAFRQGQRQAEFLRRIMREVLEAEPLVQVDYVEVVHPETMAAYRAEVRPPALAAVAAYVGDARLIDNMTLA